MVASIIMDDWNLGTTIDGYDLQLYDVGIIVSYLMLLQSLPSKIE